MWQMLGSIVDVSHALLMGLWVLGLPLLFWQRWPRVTRAYSLYAVVFVVISQVSHFAIGECFLTTLARRLREHGPPDGAADAISRDWFVVRLTRWVFDMIPTHRTIIVVSEVLIFVTAIGELLWLRRSRDPRRVDKRPSERTVPASRAN